MLVDGTLPVAEFEQTLPIPAIEGSECLDLEWLDLDYAGEPAKLLVRKSKTRRARTVWMHRDLVQLFTNWPANRAPRDKVVAFTMRTARRVRSASWTFHC